MFFVVVVFYDKLGHNIHIRPKEKKISGKQCQLSSQKISG